MARLVNQFSWSNSRNLCFRECKRKYYYNYYGQWGGWENEAPEAVREIYVLKQLKSRYMWAGSIVHDSISEVLGKIRKGLPFSPEETVTAARERMRADFRLSRDGEYWNNPKTCALFEHEYKINVPDAKWKDMWLQVENCIGNFFKSDMYRQIKSLDSSSWLPIEEFQSFKLGGDKINVKIDFPFREGNDIVIVDWKTGKSASRSEDVQLACYALFAMEAWQAVMENIRTVEFNLYSMARLENRVSEDVIANVREVIASSIAEMKAMLKDAEANRADFDDFQKTDNARACSNCNYKKLCFPGK